VKLEREWRSRFGITSCSGEREHVRAAWVCGCEDDAGIVEVWESRGWLRGEHGLGFDLGGAVVAEADWMG
jgi:hypothetical protein